MSEKTPDESTRSIRDPDADRPSKDTAGDPEEWTGGHRKPSPESRGADPAQLPELEVEEDSVVKPENS